MKDFSVDFFSDSRYKKMTAEISFEGQILCQVNKDKGIDNMEIEFFYDQRVLERDVAMKFPVTDFLKTLKTVTDELSRIED